MIAAFSAPWGVALLACTAAVLVAAMFCAQSVTNGRPPYERGEAVRRALPLWTIGSGSSLILIWSGARASDIALLAVGFIFGAVWQALVVWHVGSQSRSGDNP